MSRPIDPLLDPDRRRPASSAPLGGRPLPPPVPAQRPTGVTSPVPPVRPVGRRRGPARGSKVASLALSVSTTLGLAAVFAQNDVGAAADPLLDTAAAGSSLVPGATDAPVSTESAGTPTALDPAVNTQPVTTQPVTIEPTAPSVTGSIADGTYLGVASTNRWGTVQVQAVYAGGSLVDVQILSYPDGDRKSIAINQRCLPSMIDDAISIQAADVSRVSGATYTWRSYTASLQSAIESARAASGLS